MELQNLLVLLPTAISIIAYCTVLVGFWIGWQSANGPTPLGSAPPRVSLLKPLAGADDELRENLASFALLDYPDFEVLIGVASLDDAALPIAREFVQSHPEIDARIIITDPVAARNPKVAQLVGLERAATGRVLVISDSNVRVLPRYLQDLVTHLEEPGVGLVSSAIVGIGERSTGAALENLQLAAFVTPVVVASQALRGQAVTVGKSMAMWRHLLEGLGGFREMGDVLAEDHVLGQAFSEAGHRVLVSTLPIYNVNVSCSVERTLERHSRWAKMRRTLVPATFFFELLLLPIAIASAMFIVAPGVWSAIGVGFAATCQLAGSLSLARALRGSFPDPSWVGLELLRTAVVALCWARACLSRRVSWRGHEFEILPGSRIVPYEPRRWTRPRVVES